MHRRLVTYFSLFPYVLVPWMIVLFFLSLIMTFPRGWFLALHYLADISLFGLSLHYYYEAQPSADAFDTTAYTAVTIFAFEAILFVFVIPHMQQYLTFIDWIFPAFLITTVVYFLGKHQ